MEKINWKNLIAGGNWFNLLWIALIIGIILLPPDSPTLIIDLSSNICRTILSISFCFLAKLCSF